MIRKMSETGLFSIFSFLHFIFRSLIQSRKRARIPFFILQSIQEFRKAIDPKKKRIERLNSYYSVDLVSRGSKARREYGPDICRTAL